MTDQENKETAAAIKVQIISFFKTRWGRFILGIFTIYIIGKIGVGLATHDHLIIACFFAVIAGIIAPFPVMSANWKGGPLVGTIFIVIFAGMIPCFSTRYGGNGYTVSGIMVSDAPKYTSETVFHFLDGKVMKDYYGYEPIMGRHYKVGDAYVAPIVPDDWKPSDPVPAWAYSEYRSPEEWDQEFRAGVRQSYDEVKQDAIKDAEKENYIKSAENAPILMWTNKPEREVAITRGLNRILFFSFALIWSILFWYGEYFPDTSEKKTNKYLKNKKPTES